MVAVDARITQVRKWDL